MDIQRQAMMNTIRRLERAGAYCRIAERVILERGLVIKRTTFMLMLSLGLNIILLIVLTSRL
jgi:hypothetical protein